MLKKSWLVFAQAVTVALAVVFVLATLKPHWLPGPLSQPTARGQSGQASDARTPGSPAGSGSAAGPDSAGGILSYRDAATRATASVVNIFTSKNSRLPSDHPLLNDPMFRRFFGEQQRGAPSSSLGSGVVVSADGYVLTNHHVIESADGIEVAWSDGRRASARLVGSDPESDLAVLKIDADKGTLKDLVAIEFGDPDRARIGDVVLAVGNPFGVGQTVTMGIISALGRTQLGINTFENFIQTDAAINPGNSGGALVDTQGHLLGINTAIYSRTGGSLGIGFAIPVSTARTVMDQIVKTGAVVRGYIGVEPQDVTPELAQAFRLPRQDGAIIAGVMRSGPADKAGVKPGDILIEADGKAIPNTATMLNVIAQIPPGSTRKFVFVRDGRDVGIDITVGKRPAPGARQAP
ncbi:MAG: trypsin-like peptidase domain-containing protein [Burkholderiales bacterium]|jgi:serine protease DegQ